MTVIQTIVSNVPQITPGTASQLASPIAAEASQPHQQPPAVEVHARLRAGMETAARLTDSSARFADAAPAAVGRFATTRRVAPPPNKSESSESGAEAKDKDSLIELFAGARPEVSTGAGRSSGSLSRALAGHGSGGQESVGRFETESAILPRTRTQSPDASEVQQAFAGGIGRFQPAAGGLSAALLG